MAMEYILLKRLVPSLKCMELACWVLQASLDQNNYLRQVKMMTKKHLGHQICLCCLASICQASNLNQPPLKAVKMLNFHAFLGPTQVSCLAERSWESGATFFNYINSVETNGITGKIRFEVRKNSIIQINYLQNWYFCYQNCSDLLWEKIILVIEKNFWNSRLKAENLQNFWDH